MMQEAMFWNKERNGVRCVLCSRNCFISKEKFGYCLVRKNVDNKLFALNYGKLVSVNIEPIERTPLYHFLPNSNTLTITGKGNNFRCQFCQDWQVNIKNLGEDHTPEDIVEFAEEKNCKSISYSYTEPTMYFEFAFRAAKLAHRGNIKNIFVTNGYMIEETVKKISKFLDGIVVNLKASVDPEFYKKFLDVPDTKPIFQNLRQMRKQRLHIEITNLIIPQIGDNIEQCRKLAEYVNAEVGSETPFHVLQFHPDFKLLELPLASTQLLERCIDEAKKAGLRYVYIGNVPGHTNENTYCYNCREPLIMREHFKVKQTNLSKDRCPNCGLRINIVVE